MAPAFLIDLPAEILDIIIQHCYPQWTIYILDRLVHGTLAIDGLPRFTLLLVNKKIADLALRHERKAFTGQMVFTTSSTQWRLLDRLRTISPSRLGWVVDNTSTLVFCSPPLFTNRIPWASLPGLKRIELDYCYRSANFRCQGTAKELRSGHLDPMIVGFARDTERFDMPLVEDAWRGSHACGPPSAGSEPDERFGSIGLGIVRKGSSSSNATSIDSFSRRVEVLVIKHMHIFESAAVAVSPAWPAKSETGRSSATSACMKPENWKIKVTATHRGRLEDVRFEIVSGNHETPFGETVIWIAEKGLRDTIPLEGKEAGAWVLEVKRNGEREKYLCQDEEGSDRRKN